jgi:hypothetical protein
LIKKPLSIVNKLAASCSLGSTKVILREVLPGFALMFFSKNSINADRDTYGIRLHINKINTKDERRTIYIKSDLYSENDLINFYLSND